MSNMRIVYDNAADRATVTASSTAGALVVANLLTDRKSDVWRATGPAASIYAAWPAAEAIQAVALPFCNLSPAATMRVRVTNELPATNVLTAPNDFTNAAWTKTNLSVAAGVAGPDGTNSGTTLTASAANGEIKQTRTVAAGANASSIFVRRRAGSGAVSIRNAANTAWIPLAGLSTSWTRFANDGGVTGTSALVDVLIATSGDAVDVAFAQLEAGGVTSYYPGTRPLGYIDTWQSYAYDSGAQLACPAPALRPRGWTAAQAASAYAYGGGAYARMWLPAALQAYGLAVDIVDAGNLQGYIEAARLVAGPYWSPVYNASDASMTVVDTTELYRTDAGDQGANAGYRYRRVPVSLSTMPAADRATCANILRNSRAYPVLVSVFPEVADLVLERDHMVYGRRSKDSDVAIQYATAYSTTIEIEEI